MTKLRVYVVLSVVDLVSTGLSSGSQATPCHFHMQAVQAVRTPIKPTCLVPLYPHTDHTTLKLK